MFKARLQIRGKQRRLLRAALHILTRLEADNLKKPAYPILSDDMRINHSSVLHNYLAGRLTDKTKPAPVE
jgi:hypothetical protein